MGESGGRGSMYGGGGGGSVCVWGGVLCRGEGWGVGEVLCGGGEKGSGSVWRGRIVCARVCVCVCARARARIYV